MKRETLVQLRRTIVPIRDLPTALSGMRIVHLSDLHLSAWTAVAEQTRRLLGAIEFDLLAVTGDFTHHPPRWQNTLDLLERLFAPIASVTPIYAVLGNHDLPELAEHHQTPIRFLRNESTIIRFNGACLRLAGVAQTFGQLPHSVQALRDLERALADPADAPHDHECPPGHDIPTILLAHFPSTVYKLPAPVAQRPSAVVSDVAVLPGRGRPGYVAQRPSAVVSDVAVLPGRGRPGYVAQRPSAVSPADTGIPGRGRPGYMTERPSGVRVVDLVLSGHTHGGQIRVPSLGCIWANDAIPLRFARGLHRVGDTLLHTSAGIGVSGPLRFRFNCPPELTLLCLQPQRFIGPKPVDDANTERASRALSRV